MSRVFDIDEISSEIEDILNNSEEISLKVNTDNMLPLLRKGKDIATVSKIKNLLNENDIVLYRKENDELSFSRIKFVSGETFVLCGDSSSEYEYNVCRDRIIALLISFDRNGKTYKVSDKSSKAYRTALPVTKELWKYTVSMNNRTKSFIKFLKKK